MPFCPKCKDEFGSDERAVPANCTSDARECNNATVSGDRVMVCVNTLQLLFDRTNMYHQMQHKTALQYLAIMAAAISGLYVLAQSKTYSTMLPLALSALPMPSAFLQFFSISTAMSMFHIREDVERLHAQLDTEMSGSPIRMVHEGRTNKWPIIPMFLATGMFVLGFGVSLTALVLALRIGLKANAWPLWGASLTVDVALFTYAAWALVTVTCSRARH